MEAQARDRDLQARQQDLMEQRRLMVLAQTRRDEERRKEQLRQSFQDEEVNVQRVKEARERNHMLAREKKELKIAMKLENVNRMKRIAEYKRLETLRQIHEGDKRINSMLARKMEIVQTRKANALNVKIAKDAMVGRGWAMMGRDDRAAAGRPGKSGGRERVGMSSSEREREGEAHFACRCIESKARAIRLGTLCARAFSPQRACAFPAFSRTAPAAAFAQVEQMEQARKSGNKATALIKQFLNPRDGGATGQKGAGRGKAKGRGMGAQTMPELGPSSPLGPKPTNETLEDRFSGAAAASGAGKPAPYVSPYDLPADPGGTATVTF